MKAFLLCCAVCVCILLATLVARPFLARRATVSAQVGGPCGSALYPSGCNKFDSATIVCGNNDCGSSTMNATGMWLAGYGNQVQDMRLTDCPGCPQECAPQSVATVSSCPTPTPTPTTCYPCAGDPDYWWWNEDQCAPDYHWSCTQCKCIRNSPIIVDVDGNGFRMTDGPGGVYFNMNQEGAERTSWTAAGSDDAFLVLDRNGNGTIDDGTELFGNRTAQPESADPNGFIALAEFDKPGNGGNSNGLIDSGDAIFSYLRLWEDTNHNALSEPAELFRLSYKGITSFELAYKEARRKDQFRNEFRYRAKVNGTGTAARYAWDLFLTYW